MCHVLEVIFRQAWKLLILIVLLPVIAVGTAYFVVPHTYASSASLWALRPYDIIGDTTPAANPPPTPADTQVAALSALLQTHDFDLAVANEAGLAATLDASQNVTPQLRDTALIDDIVKNVHVASQGYNLFTITYINRNPQISQQIVAAIVRDYGSHSVAYSQSQGQTMMANYKQQLADAQQSANTATAVEQQYLATHPGVTKNIWIVGPQYAQLFDPEYALLHTRTEQAVTRMQSIETQITTLQLQIASMGSTADTLFKVIDAPVVAKQPEGRTRQYLMAGGAALGLALLACVLYIIMLVRSDHAVYTMRDLKEVTAYPVLIQLPHLTAQSRLLLIESST